MTYSYINKIFFN